MIRIILAVSAFVCMSLFVNAQTQSPLQLMPVPAKQEFHSGQLRVDADLLIRQTGHREERLDRAVDRMYQRLSLKLAIPVPPVKLASQKPRVLEVICGGAGPTVQQAREDESYELEVRPDGATLKAPLPIGILHGLETFYQLVTIGADQYGTAPAISIHDNPRFPWRGLLLDVSRHYIPTDQIERTIEGLAAVKMNVLHLHLSDDQAFRVASSKAPELAEKGSRGQFYTRDELKAVVAYGRDRGVRIVPEFDIPGHTTAWLASHPELATVPNKTYEPWPTYGTSEDVLDPTNPKLLKLLDRLVGDMAQIFPDEYFHIGGDEVVYKQWNESPTITEFRKKNNLADGRALQAWFNTQVAQILKKHHKRMIGWNEILHGEIPQDTVIQNWIGVEALQEAVNRHFDVVISLGYYLDWQMPAWYHYGIDPLRPDPPSADPLIKDANYDKFAALRADQSQAVALPAGSEKYILGGEAAEWTELAGPWNVDSVIWPRLGAVAERLWSPMDVRDVEYLYQRFPELNAELADLGIRVTDGPQTMRLRLAGTLEGATTLGLFAEAIEPVKYYGRNESKRPEYNTLGPFNRLADALASESIVATNFHFAVTRYLKSRNADDLAPVRLTVQRWNTNHAALDALLRNNPRLQEAKPVAESLHLATGGALDAIDYIQRGERAPAAWIAAQQTILQSAKPTADMRLVVLDSIQSLINAAGQ